MRKTFIVLLAVAVLTAFAMPALASPGENLKEGLKTFFMSPKQVPDNIQAEYDAHDNKVLAVIGGTFKGLFYFGKDLVVGAARVLTFPIDWNNE